MLHSRRNIFRNVHTRLALKVPIGSHTVVKYSALSSRANCSRLPSNLAFDTFLITEPKSSPIADHISHPRKIQNKTAALLLPSLSGLPRPKNLLAWSITDEGGRIRSIMPLRLKTTVEVHHQRNNCHLNVQPFRLAEKQHVAFGKIVSSRLLHVSQAQRYQKVQNQGCFSSRSIMEILNKSKKKMSAMKHTRFMLQVQRPCTLRSLFTSLSHDSLSTSKINHCAQGRRGALVIDFCIECELSTIRQPFT